MALVSGGGAGDPILLIIYAVANSTDEWQAPMPNSHRKQNGTASFDKIAEKERKRKKII